MSIEVAAQSTQTTHNSKTTKTKANIKVSRAKLPSSNKNMFLGFFGNLFKSFLSKKPSQKVRSEEITKAPVQQDIEPTNSERGSISSSSSFSRGSLASDTSPRNTIFSSLDAGSFLSSASSKEASPTTSLTRSEGTELKSKLSFNFISKQVLAGFEAFQKKLNIPVSEDDLKSVCQLYVNKIDEFKEVSCAETDAESCMILSSGESRYLVFTSDLKGEANDTDKAIYLGINFHTGEPVVISCLDCSENGVENNPKALESQRFQALQSLSSDRKNRITKLHDLFVCENQQYLVSEWGSEGDLIDYLGKHKLKSSQKKSMAEKIVAPFIALHKNNMVHRDVKPENFVVDQKRPMLMDFDFLRFLDSDFDEVGSNMYLPPESLNGNGYTTNSEMWSVACVLYQVFTGDRPQFVKDLAEGHIKTISAENIQELSFRNCSKKLTAIMKKAFSVNPEDRYSASELANALQNLESKHY